MEIRLAEIRRGVPSPNCHGERRRRLRQLVPGQRTTNLLARGFWEVQIEEILRHARPYDKSYDDLRTFM